MDFSLDNNPSDDGVVQVQDENTSPVQDKMDTEPTEPSASSTASPQIRADDLETMKSRLFSNESNELELDKEFVHTWEIKDWKELQTMTEPKVHGPPVNVNGFNWRILLFPEGNGSQHVSLYLEASPEDGNDEDPDWAVCAAFGLVMWNPDDPTILHTSHAHHRFNSVEKDWGFTKFLDLNTMLSTAPTTSRPYLTDDNRVNITAFVRIYKDPLGTLWHNFINYNSKKMTGFVGLKNQGATCYLNSLLQSLYCTQKFRQLVYKVPTENEPPTNMSAALQRMFYLLKSSDIPVGTSQLTAAFGWDSADAFTQHDVQEMERVLMDKLESQMKGTEVDGHLNDLFVGQMKSYVKCLNVDFESSRTEDFWDLQLSVRGMGTLQRSFEEYIKEEVLSGENQYQATGYGLQDAAKGVAFKSFPPILHLQLARYEYDFERDAMAKINDRYEFPLEIDLSPYLDKDVDRNGESWVYALHGVLVHAGDQNAGHYYALLRPGTEEKWYKFDDDRVTPATMKEVLEETFGEDTNPRTLPTEPAMRFSRANIRRLSSAYMLVYLRKSRQEEILNCGEDVIPDHIPKRVEEEKEEQLRKRRERLEQENCMTVKAIGPQQFKKYLGFDLGQWDDNLRREGEIWTPQAQPVNLRLRKDSPMSQVYETVAQQFDVSPESIRLWTMTSRQNKTYRLDQPIANSEDRTLEETRPHLNYRHPEIRFWVEVVEANPETKMPILSSTTDEESASPNGKSLLLLKFFDRERQEIRGVATHTVKNTDTPKELIDFIRREGNLPEDEVINLYEEVKPEMIEELELDKSFYDSEIGNGDIICFELPSQALGGEYETAADFYNFMSSRFQVTFVDKETTKHFSLVMHKKSGYNEMSAAVANQLNVEPSHIQFFTTDGDNNIRAPIKQNTVQTVRHWTAHNYLQTYSNPIVYQLLDISLDELEQKQSIVVSYLTDGLSQEHKYEILVPNTATVGDVMAQLQQKAEIKDDVVPQLKMWTSIKHQVGSILTKDQKIESLDPSAHIFVAKQTQEEYDLAHSTDNGSSRLISVQHFQKDPNRTHGIPFTFVIKRGELTKDAKKRLQKTMGVYDKVFESMRIAILSPGYAPKYIDSESGSRSGSKTPNSVTDGSSATEGESDDQLQLTLYEAIQDCEESMDENSGGSVVLGLDHYDKSVRRIFGNQAAIKMR